MFLFSIIHNKLKSISRKFSRVAIKVGSNVIAKDDGSLNTGRMLRIVEEIAVLWKQGIEVIFNYIRSGCGGAPVILHLKKNKHYFSTPDMGSLRAG